MEVISSWSRGAAGKLCELINGVGSYNSELGHAAYQQYLNNAKLIQAAYVQGINNCIADENLPFQTSCPDPAVLNKCTKDVRAAADTLQQQNQVAYGTGALGQGPIPGISAASDACRSIPIIGGG